MSASIRPSARSYNSWDSLRYSQRVVPQIDTQLSAPVDAFTAGPSLEAGTRRPSATASIRVDEAAPNPLYTLGWRSYLQIWATLATTTTLIIAANNLYARLHGKN